MMTIPCGEAASIIAYVEAPGVEATSVAGATTVNFDGLTRGIFTSALVTTIGTYDAGGGPAYAITGADAYGGAGDKGNYMAIGAQSGSTGPVILTLNTPSNYFGFWWSAGDSQNSVSFYNGAQLLATISTAQLVALIPNDGSKTVTTVNGSVYHANQYYNNPNGGDASEPFAYVDFIATGLTFNRVAFSNASLGTGFESDNHSVASNVIAPPTSDVMLQNLPLSTPEPGTCGLIGMALCGVALVARKKAR